MTNDHNDAHDPPRPPEQKRHAFYVSPEGSAPATTPRYAPPPPRIPPTRLDLEMAAIRRQVRIGAAIFLGGLALSIGSCVTADAAGSGHFLLFTGPMVAGLGIMVRAGC